MVAEHERSGAWDKKISGLRMPEFNGRQVVSLAAPAFCVCYFLWLAGDELGAFFTADDLMNLAALHGYFHIPLFEIFQQSLTVFTEGFRPVGGLFYRLLYSVFGFDPFPFHVAAFALMGVNLFFAYNLVRILSGSREAALIAAFILSYNVSFIELYRSTGTIYDVLCFGFFVGSFRAYLGGRLGNKRFGLTRVACVLLLYAYALGSKEMAVSFPVVLTLYEAVYHPNQFHPRNIFESLRKPHFFLIASSAIITALYSAVKLLSNNPLGGHPGYTPNLSFDQFAISLAHYLPRWLYWPSLDETGTLALVLAAAAVAFFTRARELMFGICFVLVTLLPIAFILPRGGFAFYLPALGCVLFIGSAATYIIRRLSRVVERAAKSLRHQNRSIVVLRAVPFAVLVFALTPVHRGAARVIPQYFHAEHSQQIISDLQDMHPAFPDGATLYFDDDPYPKNSYTLLFLVQLAYDNQTINVERQKILGFYPPVEGERTFFRFTVREGRVEPVFDPPPTTGFPENAVRMALQPELVRPGEKYSVRVEQFAGTTIDVYFRHYTSGRHFYYSGIVHRWCSFDAEGFCTVLVPKYFPESRVEILYARASAEKGRWHPAAGVLEVRR